MADLLQIQGKGSLRLDGVLTQTIGDTYESLECFNSVQSERGDVAVVAGTVGSLTYTGTDAVEGELHIGINADFAANDELDIIPYINGVAYDDNPMTIRGLGVGKPVVLFWISQVSFTPNDVITLMAKNVGAGDININFTRSVFAMKIDG